MTSSRAALAATTTGCLLAAGLTVSGLSQAWAQVAIPNAEAPQINTPPDDETLALGDAEVAAPFSAGAGVSLGEFYDSNPNATTNGPSDALTQGELDMHVHDRTARFQGDLAYSLTGNYHSGQSDLNSIQNYLNAIGQAELWVDHLFLSARAFAWPTFLSRLGSLDAGNGTSSSANVRNAYGYSAQPDLRFRFDDFATSDLVAIETGSFFTGLSNQSQGSALPFAIPTGTQSTTVSEKLKGGEGFGRLEWSLSATGTNAVQTGLHESQRVGEANLDYHVSHSFGILVDVGYRSYHSRPALTHGLSGLFAMGGIDFSPSPSFRLIAKAGKQYNFPSYTGYLRYQFGAFTYLLATLDDTITTPQDRLLIDLQGLDVSPGGVFVVAPSTAPDQSGPSSGLSTPSVQPINISPYDQLALDNDISRYRTATAGLVQNIARATLALTFYGQVRDYLVPLAAVSTRQTVYGGDLSETYNITQSLTFTTRADYSIAHEFGGLDKIATLTANLNYSLSPAWSIFARASVLKRNARDSLFFINGDLTDTQAGAGLRYNF